MSSVMRQSTTSTVSNVRSPTFHNDNNFDALLEDLQATVSRSNSLRTNGSGPNNMSGYREVRRTVKDDATGESTTEYHIEYLHPANSTTHVTEYSTSPYYNHTGYGVAGQHNKEITYKYNTASNQSKSDYWSSGERQSSLSRLDSRDSDSEVQELLRDFRTPLQSNDQVGLLNSSSSGFDNVPLSGSRAIEERHFKEERRETRGSSSQGSAANSARRELVFTGPRSREPSPSSMVTTTVGTGPRGTTQQIYRYEKTTSTKTIGPDGTVLYDSGTVRSPSPQYLQYRDPSPGRRPRELENIKYTTSTPNQNSGSYSMKTSNYSYNTTSSSHNEVPRTPPPHRSPSPVSFTQPPTPVRSSVSRTTAAQYSSQDVPSSPTLARRYTPDPNRYGSSPQSHVYKYSSTSTTSDRYTDSKPRPFPTPSPTMDQQPPKKLDDLMASLGDIDSRETLDGRTRVHSVRTETTTTTSNSSGRRKEESHRHQADSSPATNQEPPHTQTQVKEQTKNISGPPVYYPKGELFAKKEESLAQREGGGGKYKAKAKYQYEAGSKYKESSDTKVVPVCVPCPCCCAAPCSIM